MNRFFQSFFLLIVFFGSPLFSCTIFSLNKDEGSSFAGNNCDCPDLSYGYLYIEPGCEFKYGALYFGSIQDRQCGMNERGLFYADASIPHWSKGKFRNVCEIDIRQKLMQECATVDEAIELFKRYGSERLFSCVHMLVADSGRKSVVFEWDGEKLEAICKKGSYQIITNFPLLQIKDDSSVSCWRYLSAKKLLDSNPATIETCPMVLDWTHRSPTLYSVVGDLKQGMVYLYFNHNFNDVSRLNIHDELKKGPKRIRISSLFERDDSR